MNADASIRFFDAQFERQLREAEPALNPFEQRALPWLHGRVLELGGHFAGWEILDHRHEDFPAPRGTLKAFDTVIARKPGGT